MAFASAIGDDARVSRIWLSGVGVAAAIVAVSGIWRAWRAYRGSRDLLGSISPAWMNQHRARDSDHDPKR